MSPVKVGCGQRMRSPCQPDDPRSPLSSEKCSTTLNTLFILLSESKQIELHINCNFGAELGEEDIAEPELV